MIRRVAASGALCLLLCAHSALAQQASYHLIDNFTASLPPGDNIECTVQSTGARVGIACARLGYRFGAGDTVRVSLPQEEKRVPAQGNLRLWVKGDNSGNTLHLCLVHAEVVFDGNGSRSLRGHAQLPLPAVTLDFDTWKEFGFKVAGVPPGRSVWLADIIVRKRTGADPVQQGEVLLDDLRLYPDSGSVSSSATLQLFGPRVRPYSPSVAFAIDVRHFGADPVSVQARVEMTDHNENIVAQREFEVKAPANEPHEELIQFEPENWHLFLPPFHVKGELSSAELPQLSSVLDLMLVVGNSYLLFDDFSDVYGRWFTSGMPFAAGQLFGEEQHAYARTQTAARIGREEIGPANGPNQTVPPGRYALRIDYTGAAVVYNGTHRYLPGDAYAMGVWIRGDGGGAEVQAVILDFAAAGSTFYTWNRSYGGRRLCTLDFEGWRYVEVPLPGDGVGPRTPRGGTGAIDFPLDLSAFVIAPSKDHPAGTACIGPVFIHTQQSSAESLSAQVGYDDPNNAYAPDRSAWVCVQNGWRIGGRTVNATWTLYDREEEVIVSGRQAFDLKPMELRTFRVELAQHAAKIAGRLGPLRLQVAVSDARGDASAEAQIVLAKTDSVVLLADFEAARGYLGLKVAGVDNPPPTGRPAAMTTTQQKHSGERSLALPWQKGKTLAVSVDPPLPGAPTTASLWVLGDGSGALFYPLIGDQFGVVSGVWYCEWDLFLPRTDSGPLQNAVKVDWKGWRELTFQLPPIPSGWKESRPILPFVPSYPLGLHLVTMTPPDAAADAGMLHVDDIRIRTHLQPADRLSMELDPLGQSNLVLPGSTVSVTISNRDATPAATARKAVVSGGLYDWRGRRVAGTETSLEVAPSARTTVVITKSSPLGAYELQIRLKEGDRTVASIVQDLLVIDAPSVLGPQWQEALCDTSRLRTPLGDRYALIAHDWDWAEFQPGNLQAETLLACVTSVQKLGHAPYALLGYSTYWASSFGYEDMLKGQLSDRNPRGPGGRDEGHATDIFHAPERLDDWDNYVHEMMRMAGNHVAGWILWNTPDSTSFLGVPPKRFTQMITMADQWRRRYCPQTPLILGGLSRETALPYLNDLIREGALEHFTGIDLRVDAGRISPEDGQLAEYVGELQSALNVGKDTTKTILLTDMDWAVEKAGQGLEAFDQAAYLARALLLLDRIGVHPALTLHNEDMVRLGFGLVHKNVLTIPPLTERTPSFCLKPAWWAMTRVKDLLGRMKAAAEIRVQDVVPGRTRCVLYQRNGDSKTVAAAWRDNDEGEVSFSATGMTVESAEDIFGVQVAGEKGWYGVGKVPVVFVLNAKDEPAEVALTRLHVRDAGQPLSWPQEALASFTRSTGRPWNYTQSGAREAPFAGRTTDGQRQVWEGLEFTEGGSEEFTVNVPEGAGLILRKLYYLGEVAKEGQSAPPAIHGAGQLATVSVNEQPAGTLDLRRTDKDLSSGLREAVFAIAPPVLAGKNRAVVKVSYPKAANTARWIVCAYRGGEFPLSTLGPIHADSPVTWPRVARNAVGHELRIGKQAYPNGIGTFAPCLIEYPLNGQLRRLTAEVGIDAATEGRGSVVFEVHGDGKLLWKSGLMSGLDKALTVDVDVSNVNRLRLIVTDGGDGNKMDVANWCNATLHR